MAGGGDGNASATRITPGNALRPEDIALEVSTGLVKPTEDVAEYALRIGDDALILAQRLGHWISRAPELEEDIALGNIALDQLGHARSLPHLRRRRHANEDGTPSPRMTWPTSAASTSSAPCSCSSSPTATSRSPSPGSSW